jgi:thiol-disulfide isomerase/thioredoxin
VRFEPVLVLAAVWCGCEDKPVAPPVERFASVKRAAVTASAAFCEKSFPARGPGAMPLSLPRLRDFGGSRPKASGWTWVNLWATWCKPCVDEMGLLSKWGDAFGREGLAVSFELLSVDDDDARPALEQWKAKDLPGHVSWLSSPDDLGPFFERLGVDKAASIPVHVVVDSAGMVRCVRVGAIHQENWGAVRALIAGG